LVEDNVEVGDEEKEGRKERKKDVRDNKEVYGYEHICLLWLGQHTINRRGDPMATLAVSAPRFICCCLVVVVALLSFAVD